MGGTLIRLVEDQHEVHVAYMTSGNIAVFDHDAQPRGRPGDRIQPAVLGSTPTSRTKSSRQVARSLGAQEAGQARHARGAGDQGADSLERGQGRRHRGRLPGRAPALSRPAVLSHRHDRQEADHRGGRADHPRADRAARTRSRSTWPATCPIRTARTAFVPRRSSALWRRSSRAAAGPRCCSIAGPGRNGRRTRSRSRCRSARATWHRKRAAIFRHESQKDSALFPGPDDAANSGSGPRTATGNTADVYNQIGLPEYFALEGFVRWNGVPI